MELRQLRKDSLTLVINSLRIAIGTLQMSLLKSADELDDLSPATAELKQLAVDMSLNVNPLHPYLEIIKTGSTPKAVIFLDEQGIARDLVTGKTLSGQQCIDLILDNIKISQNG